MSDNKPVKFPTSRAKLKRAEFHRVSIRDEIIEYATSNRIKFSRVDNLANLSAPTIRVEYTVSKVESPPERWALVAGDAIQNTRAALDHAIWALVVKRRGSNWADANRRKIMFPLVDAPDLFPQEQLESWGLKPRVIDAIRQAQPFSIPNADNPRRHALWFLRELSNVDKHQMLHVIVLIPEEVSVNPTPFIPDGKLEIVTRGPIFKSAPAITFTAPRPSFAGRVKVDLEYKAGICFAETERTAATSIDVAMEAMHNEALRAIDSLEEASSLPRRAHKN